MGGDPKPTVDPNSLDVSTLRIPSPSKMATGSKDQPGPSRSNSTLEEDKIELNVLLKFIKPFDGSRDRLNPFLANCQNAYNLASKSQKPILFRFMLSQLEGRAESTCSIKEFDTFEQFAEFLKQQFGEKKHYAHLLSELQNSKQAPAEAVNVYALRVEKCLAKLLTEINISVPTKKKTEVAGRVAAMEDLALHTFITGLYPRLSQIVRCRDPDTLNEAINFAVAEEKLTAGFFAKRPFVPRRDSHPPYTNFSVNPQNNRRGATPSAGPVICRYCKNPGHLIENCRKREYNNRMRAEAQTSSQGQGPAYNRNAQNPTPSTSRGVFFTDNNLGVDEVDRSLNE